MTAREPDEICMPSRVDFRDRGLVFVATKGGIQQWMQHIDQWIATANEGVAKAEARRVHEAGREKHGLEEEKQRVADADSPCLSLVRTAGTGTTAGGPHVLNDVAALGVAAVIVFVLATILGALERIRKILWRDGARGNPHHGGR